MNKLNKNQTKEEYFYEEKGDELVNIIEKLIHNKVIKLLGLENEILKTSQTTIDIFTEEVLSKVLKQIEVGEENINKEIIQTTDKETIFSTINTELREYCSDSLYNLGEELENERNEKTDENKGKNRQKPKRGASKKQTEADIEAAIEETIKAAVEEDIEDTEKKPKKTNKPTKIKEKKKNNGLAGRKGLKEKYGIKKLKEEAEKFFSENGLKNRLDLFVPENKEILETKKVFGDSVSFITLAGEISGIKDNYILTHEKLNLLSDKMGFKSIKEEILTVFKNIYIIDRKSLYKNVTNGYENFLKQDFYKGITGKKLIQLLSGKRNMPSVGENNFKEFADKLYGVEEITKKDDLEKKLEEKTTKSDVLISRLEQIRNM